MAEALYILSAATSLACFVLLFRGFRRTRVRLLFWSSLCFAALTVNNLLLYADRAIWLDRDLLLARDLTSLAGISILVFGLIWEVE